MQMMVRHKVILLLVIVGMICFVGALFSLSGCAGMQSKPMYVAVAQEYVSLSKAYNDSYDRAPFNTQTKWYAEIDPAFNACDVALDIWRDSIGTPDAGKNRLIYQQALRELIVLLTKYGIVEVR